MLLVFSWMKALLVVSLLVVSLLVLMLLVLGWMKGICIDNQMIAFLINPQ